MDNPGIYSLGDRGVTVALTDQVITEGAAASGAAQAFIDRLENVGSVTLSVEFDYGSGGTTCVVVVQTSINQGADWIDIARFDFAQANRVATATVVAGDEDVATVAALLAEGKQNVLGDRLRAKVTTTGTYAGNTTVGVRAAVREGGVARVGTYPIGGSAAAAFSTTQNALSTAAEIIVAANTSRRFAEVKNADATISVYIGKDNTVSSSTGHLVKAGEAFGFEGYTGAIWAIAASGTPTVTTIEW